jgi:hypothetical protein
MADNKFLTPEEVSERYCGGISVGTLRNWRALRIGPTFGKIGTAVPYPFNELDARSPYAGCTLIPQRPPCRR